MEKVRVENTMQVESLDVRIFGTSEEMGEAAAAFVSESLTTAIQEKDAAALILATGASQFEFLNALKRDDSIEWSKITIFHLDEYLGMDEHHPASFRKYLRERILDDVKPGQVHYIEGDTDNVEGEVLRYENLLRTHEVDVACIGVGENGHLAFNDPHDADFNESRLVKIVELDDRSRQQQYGEGWFESIGEVPARAITLTIPAILRSKVISCVVPAQRKAEAVFKTLNGPISTDCPATILRRHGNAVLFLDSHSASKLS